jgi:hypothetical protein
LTWRAAIRAALLATAAAAIAVALGPPRFTWENDGLRVDHPPQQGAAAACRRGVVGSWPARAARVAGLVLAGPPRRAHRLRGGWAAKGLRERTLAGGAAPWAT